MIPCLGRWPKSLILKSLDYWKSWLNYITMVFHWLLFSFELFILYWSMAPHSSTLAWKILWTEEPGRLQSMGSLRVGHDWATSLSLFTFMHWRRKSQPTPASVLAWRIPGMGEPGGLPSTGSHRVRHDWSDLAAAAAAYPFFRGSTWPRDQTMETQGLLLCRWILYQLNYQGSLIPLLSHGNSN